MRPITVRKVTFCGRCRKRGVAWRHIKGRFLCIECAWLERQPRPKAVVPEERLSLEEFVDRVIEALRAEGAIGK